MTADLDRDDARPYFLWDEDLSIAELRERLNGFFEREKGFFLTGGGTLVGFYLEHRETDDLDLFTVDEATFEREPYALAAAAKALGGSMVARQQATGFHRYVVTCGDEAFVVDMVLDHVPQLFVDKVERDGIRIDTLAEILANKLNTIVSRAEIRDLVYVMSLDRAGFKAESDYAAPQLHRICCRSGQASSILLGCSGFRPQLRDCRGEFEDGGPRCGAEPGQGLRDFVALVPSFAACGR